MASAAIMVNSATDGLIYKKLFFVLYTRSLTVNTLKPLSCRFHLLSKETHTGAITCLIIILS